MDLTKLQLSELMCKHAAKGNGLHDLMEIMLIYDIRTTISRYSGCKSWSISLHHWAKAANLYFDSRRSLTKRSEVSFSMLFPFDTKSANSLKGFPFGKRSCIAFMKSDSVIFYVLKIVILCCSRIGELKTSDVVISEAICKQHRHQ